MNDMEEIQQKEFLDIQCNAFTMYMRDVGALRYMDYVYFSVWDVGMYRYFKMEYDTRESVSIGKQRIEKLLRVI
jgi:hypothetical protein